MLQQQSLILTVISKTRKGCPLCSQENDNWTGPQCNTDYSSTWHGIARHSVRRWPCYWNLSGKNGVGCYINRYRCIPLPHRAECPKLQEQINIRGHNKMKKLDLSGNKLYGSIPRSLLSLELLESLLLQDNYLKGSIPEFNHSSLRVFNVSSNDLNGSIPKTHTLQSFGPDSCSSNPQLCGPPTLNTCNNVSTAVDGAADHNNTNSPPDEPPRTSTKPKSATTFILLDVVGLAAVILLFIFYFKKARKLKKMIKKEDESKGGGDTTIVDDGLRDEIEEKGKDVDIREEKGNLIFTEEEAKSFQLNDLLKAPAEGLGKGNLGNCYKAMVEGRAAVVVKKIRDLKPLSSEELTRQMHIIAHQKHPNLPPLLAYSYYKDEQLLVYKYPEKKKPL